MSVAEARIHLDAVIFGGGIAGLWTIDELTRRGHSAVLIESSALGDGQTIRSQGIIHGGLKYTLAGLMNPAAETIRDMPQVWRACLAGGREPDLRGAGARAEHCYLWQTSSLASRAGMIGARLGLRIAPVTLDREERPAPLRECPGIVARLDEQVIDPARVLAVLAAKHSTRIVRADRSEVAIEGGDGVRTVRLRAGEHGAVFVPRWLVLAAGNGNAAMREALGLPVNHVQVRPLHMAMLRGDLPVLNGHCVDGAKTRATITTAQDATGRKIWQLGGELAEAGVRMTPDELIRHARAELHAVLPGFDAAGCEWSVYLAPRAEAAAGGKRPDDVSVLREGSVLTVFPTKLALAPRLAEMVAKHVGDAKTAADLSILERFDRPEVAAPPWDAARTWWPDASIAGR